MFITLKAPELNNSCFNLHCVNAPLVVILNTQTSCNPQVMRLFRPLVLTLLRYAFTIKATLIPGIDNHISDKLSRGQVPHRLFERGGFRSTPLQIPACLLPANYPI